MKKIEALLPRALAAVRAELARGKQVRKEYDGYVASLLPSIRSAGLLPTLSFYTDVHKIKADSEAKGPGLRDPRRFHILAALYRILYPEAEEAPAADALLHDALEKTYPGFQAHDLTQPFPEQARPVPADLIREISEAAVALKLALRNFEQIEK